MYVSSLKLKTIAEESYGLKSKKIQNLLSFRGTLYMYVLLILSTLVLMYIVYMQSIESVDGCVLPWFLIGVQCPLALP